MPSGTNGADPGSPLWRSQMETAAYTPSWMEVPLDTGDGLGLRGAMFSNIRNSGVKSVGYLTVVSYF